MTEKYTRLESVSRFIKALEEFESDERKAARETARTTIKELQETIEADEIVENALDSAAQRAVVGQTFDVALTLQPGDYLLDQSSLTERDEYGHSVPSGEEIFGVGKKVYDQLTDLGLKPRITFKDDWGGMYHIFLDL